ncbi:MAG: hypothetical protein JOZ03_13180 [Gammaproteobacteria bacterium]|nr:hypothetical protein [Gammaproteobacteria bacterium]
MPCYLPRAVRALLLLLLGPLRVLADPGAGAADGAGDPAAYAPTDAGMHAALGAYPMTREASGTAWQPDSSVHAGVHTEAGGWLLMSHALLNAVYDHQDGARGGEKTFLSGMAMTAATRVLPSEDIVRLRAMLSPDPLMGPAGYPLLLATGETANGRDPLIDRQHPHNLVMELSASVSHPLGAADSLYLYAGLPGEPAFGPPAFMHRLSILDSPEAPISHHWLDSMHISEGVVTVGYVHGELKLEASRFHGREPDQHRERIEPGPLDSSAVRVSFNPARPLALQVSWAQQVSAEALAPQADETRASASAIYTRPLGEDRYWSSTAAYGLRRRTGGARLAAYVLESTVQPAELWTLFARIERETNDELTAPALGPAPVYAVAKASLGALRDVRLSAHVRLGLGALYALNLLPVALQGAYGHEPGGTMVFTRVKID